MFPALVKSASVVSAAVSQHSALAFVVLTVRARTHSLTRSLCSVDPSGNSVGSCGGNGELSCSFLPLEFYVRQLSTSIVFSLIP